jgi:predicted nucleic acid-binding protein
VIAYCDTSALAALALDEAGAARVRTALEPVRRVACSEIGIVELRAAVARAVHAGRLSAAQADDAQGRWRAIWARVTPIAVTTALVQRASVLAESRALRAYGAVHLASAESLVIEIGRKRVRWVCLDRKLDEAAVALGLVAG